MTVSTDIPRDIRASANDTLELKWWLINAFNGEWAKITNVVPNAQIDARAIVR
jgi:hypothetical protein